MKRRHVSHTKLVLAILLAMGTAAFGPRPRTEHHARAAAHGEKHAAITPPADRALARAN